MLDQGAAGVRERRLRLRAREDALVGIARRCFFLLLRVLRVKLRVVRVGRHGSTRSYFDCMQSIFPGASDF